VEELQNFSKIDSLPLLYGIVPATGWNYQYKKFLASIDLRVLGKLYIIYHASPNYARQLQSCAPSLEMKILKILSTRWKNAHTKGSTERLHQLNLFWILD
jgi:hypothetical protein